MKNNKKIYSLIEEKIPDKDLFDRIESKIEIKNKRKRKINFPLITSLAATCSILLIVGVALIPNNLKNTTDEDITLTPSNGGVDAEIMAGTSKPELGEEDSDITHEGEASDDLETPGWEYGESGGGATDPQYHKTLTATEYSDLENYSYWLDLVNGKAYDENQNQITNFKMMYDSIHQNENTNYVSTKNKIDIVLKDKKDQPIPLAKVQLFSEDILLYEAVSNAKGVCNLYHGEELYEQLDIQVNYLEQNYSYSITQFAEDVDIEFKLDVEAVKNNNLDLVFLIDTTGSMGDELTYIKKELTNILDAINEYNANYNIQIGLCFYRDIGDIYVTKVFDFETAVPNVVNNLANQMVGGGGDYEEAVQEGLNKINGLSWREDSTKIAFHIFDAPSHGKDYGSVYQEYYNLASKGVRYIPIASSGLTKIGEFIAREGSILTGGTYTSLTDDSGVGGSHIEITTPSETTVEYLSDMIVRLVLEYMTGLDIEVSKI